VLVVRSCALPRQLGVWLIANSFARVTVSMTAILAPAWTGCVNKAAIRAELGELAAMMWLIAKGARVDLLRQ